MSEMEIVNYPDIRESIDLILERECEEERENVLRVLDDALGNNADELVLDGDWMPHKPAGRIINYGAIRTALDLALRARAPDRREAVLDMLDDAVTNNADHLELTDEPQTA